MAVTFRKEEQARQAVCMLQGAEDPTRKLWQEIVYMGSMVGILVFANWARSGDARAVFLCCPGGLTTYKIEGKLVNKTEETVTILDTKGETRELPAALLQGVEEVQKNSLYEWIYRLRWALVLGLLAAFAWMARAWFSRGELRAWVEASWDFAKQILPLLLAGVLLSGFLLGRPGPGQEGIIPSAWVNAAVGGNSLWANLFASIFGALMYFSTLTEVPIVQGLMGAGMGKGPALAMLLSDPALSLPSILVLRSIMGTQKTLVYVALVVVMSTISGMVYGALSAIG